MEKVKLGDIGQIITGNTPSKKNKEFYNSKDISFFKPGDIDENQINLLINSEEYISNTARDKARILPEGTVLVTCIGTIGKVGILKKESTCNQQINAIIPNERIEGKYLAYLIYNKKEYIQKKANAPVVPIINKTDFSNIEITICDKLKQIEIINKLDKVQEIIDIRKNQIKQLNELIKSQFVEMFERGQYPKDEFINIAKEIYAGGDKPKDISKVQEGEYLYPVFANGYENEGLQGYSKDYRTGNSAVTISARGTIGYSFIRNEKFTPIVRLITIIPNEKVNVVYLKYAIDNMNIAGSGTSQAQLTVPDIKKKKITIPPLELQNKFAEFVKQIDKQKFELQKRLEELQKLQESLMNKYFGG